MFFFLTSLTNKKEGFVLVMLTITSSVRLYSEAKTNSIYLSNLGQSTNQELDNIEVRIVAMLVVPVIDSSSD